MAEVHIDISVFTIDDAIGMISGSIKLPIVPQVGDKLAFPPTGAILADSNDLPFGGMLYVTSRVITAGEGNDISLMLADITTTTAADAIKLIHMFETEYGLIGDVWNR